MMQFIGRSLSLDSRLPEADESRGRVAQSHRRCRFLHSRIFASGEIPQENELHGSDCLEAGVKSSWILNAMSHYA
jgi:hypothetical protein